MCDLISDAILDALIEKDSMSRVACETAATTGLVLVMGEIATNETEELMPYPIVLAHKIALQLTKVRKEGILDYLRPDGKTQVSIEYDEYGVPQRIEAVVLSTQHNLDVIQEQLHKDIEAYVF